MLRFKFHDRIPADEFSPFCKCRPARKPVQTELSLLATRKASIKSGVHEQADNSQTDHASRIKEIEASESAVLLLVLPGLMLSQHGVYAAQGHGSIRTPQPRRRDLAGGPAAEDD